MSLNNKKALDQIMIVVNTNLPEAAKKAAIESILNELTSKPLDVKKKSLVVKKKTSYVKKHKKNIRSNIKPDPNQDDNVLSLFTGETPIPGSMIKMLYYRRFKTPLIYSGKKLGEYLRDDLRLEQFYPNDVGKNASYRLPSKKVNKESSEVQNTNEETSTTEN